MTHKHVKGITLVELLVAMALGVVLMAGVMQVFIGSNQTFGVVQAQTHMQENGRFAMEFIGRTIRHAGYDTDISFNAMTNTELKAERWPATSEFTANAVVVGDNNGSSLPDSKAGSDSLTLRFRGARDGSMQDCEGRDIAADAMVVTSFFVTEDGQFRCSTGGDVAASTATLVEGIDDLHITYGINTDLSEPSQASSYVNADEVPDWSRIVAVKIALLASSSSETLDTSAINYDFSDVGEGDLNYQDGKARQKFVQTIGLRNKLL